MSKVLIAVLQFNRCTTSLQWYSCDCQDRWSDAAIVPVCIGADWFPSLKAAHVWFVIKYMGNQGEKHSYFLRPGYSNLQAFHSSTYSFLMSTSVPVDLSSFNVAFAMNTREQSQANISLLLSLGTLPLSRLCFLIMRDGLLVPDSESGIIYYEQHSNVAGNEL